MVNSAWSPGCGLRPYFLAAAASAPSCAAMIRTYAAFLSGEVSSDAGVGFGSTRVTTGSSDFGGDGLNNTGMISGFGSAAGFVHGSSVDTGGASAARAPAVFWVALLRPPRSA